MTATLELEHAGQLARLVDKVNSVLHLAHPRKRGLTRCRRPTSSMWPTWDGRRWRERGGLQPCDACQELVRRERRTGEVLP